jgi:5-methylcytosine-specific restriction endonuclease McrA
MLLPEQCMSCGVDISHRRKGSKYCGSQTCKRKQMSVNAKNYRSRQGGTDPKFKERIAALNNRKSTDSRFRKELQRRDGAKRRGAKRGHRRVDQLDLAGKLSYWGFKCWMCRTHLSEVTWDHVKPTSRGGADELANLRPACRPCNTRKNNTWPWPTTAQGAFQGDAC